MVGTFTAAAVVPEQNAVSPGGATAKSRSRDSSTARHSHRRSQSRRPRGRRSRSRSRNESRRANHRKKSRSRSRRRSRSHRSRKRSRKRSRSKRRSPKHNRRSRLRKNKDKSLDASTLAESVARAEAAAAQVRKEPIAAAQVHKESNAWPAPPSLAVDWTGLVRQPERKCFIDSSTSVDRAEADAQRAALGIAIESEPTCQGIIPAPLQTFADLSVLPDWMTWALSENKWEAPMPIQAQALPILLSGRNLIGIAQTGSGKTMAFLIPMILHASAQRRLSRTEPGPIGLCLAPTRELAVQICDQAELLCRHSWKSPHLHGAMRSVCFYGGGRKADQMKSFTFDGSHVVVATPGRLMDFCGEKRVQLTRVTFLVLDEADRMLEMGFRGDMEQISSAIRSERQTAFFSATWSKEVQSLAVAFCTEPPVTIRVGGNGSSEDVEALTARKGITQEVVVLDFPGEQKPWIRQEQEKNNILHSHIKMVFKDPNAKMLLFVNQKNFADELSNKLWSEGIYADTLHGGRKQEDRLAVLDKFRQGQVSLLIATDVMGRGLDVQGVTHVVIYSMGGIDDYIHRIGRTGRGREAKGHALVFFEYSSKYSDWAKELIAVLEQSEQPVPPQLKQIAADVAAGKRDSWSQSSWNGSGHQGGSGGWDSNGSWGKNDWKSRSWDSNGSAKNLADSGVSSEHIASAPFVSWGADGACPAPPPPPPHLEKPLPPQLGTQPSPLQFGAPPPPPQLGILLPPELGTQTSPLQFGASAPAPQFGSQLPAPQMQFQPPPLQYVSQSTPPGFTQPSAAAVQFRMTRGAMPLSANQVGMCQPAMQMAMAQAGSIPGLLQFGIGQAGLPTGAVGLGIPQAQPSTGLQGFPHSFLTQYG